MNGRTESYKEDSIALDEGQAILGWPTPLSEHSVRDVREWLLWVIRRIERANGVTPWDSDPDPKPTEGTADA